MGLPLQVFILGLLTVFFVLMVVMASGHVIIRVVNRFFEPDPVRTPHKPSDPPPEHNRRKIAAISAAIHSITGGQGKAISIEKR
jgi:Na+-transporting methylmalonyl-CoA/oxaloacetate decarboxylase gamma subunit